MSKRLGGIIDCKDKTSSWHLNGFHYMVVTLGQRYNVEEKPTVITYSNRHSGTSNKKQKQNIKQCGISSNRVVIIYCCLDSYSEQVRMLCIDARRK